MPDNDDYLSRQLQLVSQQFGVTNPTDNQLLISNILIILIGKDFIKFLRVKLKLLSLILTVQVMSRSGVNVSCQD